MRLLHLLREVRFTTSMTHLLYPLPPEKQNV